MERQHTVVSHPYLLYFYHCVRSWKAALVIKAAKEGKVQSSSCFGRINRVSVQVCPNADCKGAYHWFAPSHSQQDCPHYTI